MHRRQIICCGASESGENVEAFSADFLYQNWLGWIVMLLPTPFLRPLRLHNYRCRWYLAPGSSGYRRLEILSHCNLLYL